MRAWIQLQQDRKRGGERRGEKRGDKEKEEGGGGPTSCHVGAYAPVGFGDSLRGLWAVWPMHPFKAHRAPPFLKPITI